MDGPLWDLKVPNCELQSVSLMLERRSMEQQLANHNRKRPWHRGPSEVAFNGNKVELWLLCRGFRG